MNCSYWVAQLELKPTFDLACKFFPYASLSQILIKWAERATELRCVIQQHFPRYSTHYIQVLSRVWLCNPMDGSTPGFPVFTISWSWLKLMSIDSVMPPNQLIVSCSLLLLLSIFPSIRAFSNELAVCIKWPKYWSFSISPSNSTRYTSAK